MQKFLHTKFLAIGLMVIVQERTRRDYPQKWYVRENIAVFCLNRRNVLLGWMVCALDCLSILQGEKESLWGSAPQGDGDDDALAHFFHDDFSSLDQGISRRGACEQGMRADLHGKQLLHCHPILDEETDGIG